MVTVVLEVAALLSGLAATDSLILGIGPYDQGRPPAG
jgi:hypothetical protein